MIRRVALWVPVKDAPGKPQDPALGLRARSRMSNAQRYAFDASDRVLVDPALTKVRFENYGFSTESPLLPAP